MICSNLFNNSNIYYSEVLKEWLNNKKDKIKESSYLKYLSIIESIILPSLGNCIFKKLTLKNIYDFFESDKMLKVSDSTKKITLIIIKSSINYGISKKYRKSFNKIDIKLKKPKSKVTYFTKKEQEFLNQYLIDNLNLRNLGILLSLYTGIRIGELCGLKWKDIDFINESISINRTVQRIKNIENGSSTKTKLVVDVPKTEHSIRTIPLPSFLILILREFKSNNEKFIFTDSLKPKDPRAVEKYFTSVLARCGIRILNFHSLRHTFATRSREAGVDIKVLSEILGHASYHVTQEIYVHISNEFKKESIDSLVDYLKSEKFVEQM